jgi:hypothetical protein
MLKLIALTSIDPSGDTATARGTRRSLSHPHNRQSIKRNPTARIVICREASTRQRKRQSGHAPASIFKVAKTPPASQVRLVDTTVGGLGIFSPATTQAVVSHVTSAYRWNSKTGKPIQIPSPF